MPKTTKAPVTRPSGQAVDRGQRGQPVGGGDNRPLAGVQWCKDRSAPGRQARADAQGRWHHDPVVVHGEHVRGAAGADVRLGGNDHEPVAEVDPLSAGLGGQFAGRLPVGGVEPAQLPAALGFAHPMLGRHRRGSGLHGAGQVLGPVASSVGQCRDIDRDGRRRGQLRHRRHRCSGGRR